MSEYKDPLVAIIVPVYNTGKYVCECIDSIINQTHSNFKCYLINDGSTDNSLELIKNHTKNDSRFIVLDQKNQGVSCARNYALDYIEKSGVSPDYIFFLDSDDLLSSNFINRFVVELIGNNADYGFCSYDEFDKRGVKKNNKTIPKPQILDNNGIISQFFMVDGWSFGGNIPSSKTDSRFLSNRFFKYKCISSLRFKEHLSFCEDHDFFIRSIPFLTKGICVPDIMFFYRMRKSSLSHSSMEKNTLIALSVYKELFESDFNYKLKGCLFSNILDLLWRAVSYSCELNDLKKEKELYKECYAFYKKHYPFPFSFRQKRRIFQLNFGFKFNRVYFKQKYLKKLKKHQNDNPYLFE